MKKLNNKAKPIQFNGEDGESLTIYQTNMGEPYRDGISLEFSDEGNCNYYGGFFELSEVRRLHKFLSEYLNEDSN